MRQRGSNSILFTNTPGSSSLSPSPPLGGLPSAASHIFTLPTPSCKETCQLPFGIQLIQQRVMKLIGF